MKVARASVLAALATCAVLLGFPAGAGTAVSEAGPSRVAIFYYPWFSLPHDGGWMHWYVQREGRLVQATTYAPTRGFYSSSNPDLVAAHMREIAATGVDTIIVSWWSDNSPEHDRLPMVARLARKNGLRVAIHVEPYQPYPRRTPASVGVDIALLHRQLGLTDFYVFAADQDPVAEWAKALAPLSGVRVFAHTTLVGRAKVSGFDGVYTYDILTWSGKVFRRLCSQARAAGLLCAPSVGPGYDARLATQNEVVLPRKDGRTYDWMWRAALRAGPDLVTVTSYNEWQEGTQIEPARAQGHRPSYEGAWGKKGAAAERAYLEATARWVDRYRADVT